ncbi:MAG: hypothetical protein KAH38_04815 [Candidatus Hydrogenedentes bacterium]|nr:hypothetical protein [Candidatus Hydrogenedentota bacterium]
MDDYIPGNETKKVQWMKSFAVWLTAHGATHGFSSDEITAFNTAATAASTAVADNSKAQTAARAATTTKNTAITRVTTLARRNAQRLQSVPHMTDKDRSEIGITIRDTIKTAVSADAIKAIEPPMLLLDFSVRRQITIHWGHNPANENKNGRPTGTIGCEIQVAQGGIPTDETLWTLLEFDTQSPLICPVDTTTPLTFAYRARFVSKIIKFGPFGDPAVCTVSV